jgi:hypothetical protein
MGLFATKEVARNSAKINFLLTNLTAGFKSQNSKEIIVRKRLKPIKSAPRRLRGLWIFVILMAVPVFAIGAITVASRQRNVSEPATQERVYLMANKPSSNLPTIKVVGQDVHVDGETGQIRALTPDEAQKIAAGLKDLINDSPEGLKTVQHADGSMSVNVEGRFQNVTVARVNTDGSVSESCVNNPKAAAAFFGIDPKLIENAPGTAVPKSKPGRE